METTDRHGDIGRRETGKSITTIEGAQAGNDATIGYTE
jgi:hypothetical protein